MTWDPLRGRRELLDVPARADDGATAEGLWELTEQVLDTHPWV